MIKFEEGMSIFGEITFEKIQEDKELKEDFTSIVKILLKNCFEQSEKDIKIE